MGLSVWFFRLQDWKPHKDKPFVLFSAIYSPWDFYHIISNTFLIGVNNNWRTFSGLSKWPTDWDLRGGDNQARRGRHSGGWRSMWDPGAGRVWEMTSSLNREDKWTEARSFWASQAMGGSSGRRWEAFRGFSLKICWWNLIHTFKVDEKVELIKSGNGWVRRVHGVSLSSGWVRVTCSETTLGKTRNSVLIMFHLRCL